MPCLPFDSCLHTRLEGDVSGGAFDDHRTVRGLCPDCCEYIVVTDYASTLSTSRKMTQAERVAWHKETCFGITCTECDTDFGDTHRDECGDTCTRAPGSDKCLQCVRRDDDEAYFRAEYDAGRLTPPAQFQRRESGSEYTFAVGGLELTVTVDTEDYPKFLIEGATDADGNDVTLTKEQEMDVYMQLGPEIASDMSSRAEFLADLAEDR